VSLSEFGTEAPPAGEEVHLPGPSIIPFAMAIGITFVVIGTTINFIISAVGLVIFLVTFFLWVRDTRRDIEDLTEEHHR
jgi:Flp pilus assembly protein TadB